MSWRIRLNSIGSEKAADPQVRRQTRTVQTTETASQAALGSGDFDTFREYTAVFADDSIRVISGDYGEKISMEVR